MRSFVVDPYVELFRWGPIKLKVLYMAYFMEAIWHEVPKHYRWSWPPIIFAFDHGHGVGVIEYPALRAVGEKYFRRYFLHRENFKRHWARYERWISDYEVFTERASALTLRRMGDRELAELYRDFRQLNRNFWLIVQVPEVANWGGETMLLRELRKLNPLRAAAHLEVLSAPVRPSFFQEEELALLRLATNVPKRSMLHALLREHAEHYAWVLNSYSGNRVLTQRYFEGTLRELTRSGSARQAMTAIERRVKSQAERKRRLVQRLKLNRHIVWMAEQLATSVSWHDHRKGYIWRLQHVGDPMLREIARRHGWRFEEIVWCLPGEVVRLVSRKRVDKRKVLRRRGDYVMVYSTGFTREYYGAAARQVRRRYQPNARAQTELRGLVVSRSSELVRGVVRVVRDPFKEVKKVRRGDVLVASMTSPEYIVVMRRAAAIVTDEGGMTSHAAITSRELGIPCIVKTGIATRVLRDGDLVEVDTSDGVVRKI